MGLNNNPIGCYVILFNRKFLVDRNGLVVTLFSQLQDNSQFISKMI